MASYNPADKFFITMHFSLPEEHKAETNGEYIQGPQHVYQALAGALVGMCDSTWRYQRYIKEKDEPLTDFFSKRMEASALENHNQCWILRPGPDVPGRQDIGSTIEISTPVITYLEADCSFDHIKEQAEALYREAMRHGIYLTKENTVQVRLCPVAHEASRALRSYVEIQLFETLFPSIYSRVPEL